jgi:TRAP-type C4-dicarboxylate transport system substrate-binding protein
VRTPSDLVSLRIRVQQSDLMQGMVRALGAQPVVLPFGQVMTALSAGLIDGAENNWPSFVAAGHYRVARFYTPTEHAMPPEVVVMSRPAWEALSPEDQKLFRAAAQESSKVMRGQWLAWEVRARQQAADAGVSVVEDFDRPAFQQAAKPLVDRALADPRLAPLIERIRAAR